MKSSKQNHTEQLNLFFEPTVLPNKPSIAIMTLPENTQQRRLNHMAKFKPFHEFQKPLIGFTPESFPHLHEDKFRLHRNGTTQRPSLQISFVGWVELKRNPTTQIIHIQHFHQNLFQHLLPNHCHKYLALRNDESWNMASQWVILPIRA